MDQMGLSQAYTCDTGKSCECDGSRVQSTEKGQASSPFLLSDSRNSRRLFSKRKSNAVKSKQYSGRKRD